MASGSLRVDGECGLLIVAPWEGLLRGFGLHGHMQQGPSGTMTLSKCGKVNLSPHCSPKNGEGGLAFTSGMKNSAD